VGEFPNVLFEITDKIVFYSLTKAVPTVLLCLDALRGLLILLSAVSIREQKSFFHFAVTLPKIEHGK